MRRISVWLFALCLFPLLHCSKSEIKSHNGESITKSISSNAEIPNLPILNFTPDSVNRIGKDFDNKFTITSSVTAAKSAGCGGMFSGTKSTSGYYIYPKDTINASLVVEGTTLSLFVDGGASTPNRFVIIDPITGSYMATSPWLGVANYSGSWGTSLNQRYGTLTFNRGSVSYYLLQVETQGNGTMTYSDNWASNLTCTSPTSISRLYGVLVLIIIRPQGCCGLQIAQNLRL